MDKSRGLKDGAVRDFGDDGKENNQVSGEGGGGGGGEDNRGDEERNQRETQ